MGVCGRFARNGASPVLRTAPRSTSVHLEQALAKNSSGSTSQHPFRQAREMDPKTTGSSSELRWILVPDCQTNRN